MKSFQHLNVFILLYFPLCKWVISILIVTLNLPYEKKKKLLLKSFSFALNNII